MFKCERCGACCCAVERSAVYQHLDRGDGSCRYFNKDTNDCSIYYDRPLICRVDEAYDKWFHSQMTLDEYYNLNYEACRLLRKSYKTKGAKGEIVMDKAEIKKTLSKRFLEICREGIILRAGVAHTLHDNLLPGNVASNAKEKICKGRVSSSDIIGILDSTIGSNGKAGFAFTLDTLFCSCFENTDSNFSIKYEDVDYVYYDNSDDDNIFLKIYRKNSDSYYKINHPWFSKKKIMWFIDEAKELYDKVNDDKLDWDKL